MGSVSNNPGMQSMQLVTSSPMLVAGNKVQKRVDVITSGTGNEKTVMVHKQSVMIQTSANTEAEAKSSLKTLRQQIESGERTLKAIILTKAMVATYEKTGQLPKDLKGVDPQLKGEVMRLYDFAMKTFGTKHAVTVGQMSELAQIQQDYVSSLHAAREQVASKLPMTPESMQKSTEFAKHYMKEHNFKAILSQMEEGDKITLSRKAVKELKQGNLPHSVSIVKDSRAPEGYRLFFTHHDKSGVDASIKYETQKHMAEGSFNKVSRLGTLEERGVVNRQPLNKTAVKAPDDIREDQVMQDMKGKSDYLMTPIGSEPSEAVQKKTTPLLEGTAFKFVKGQVMDRFDADGADLIGFDLKTNTSQQLPSVRQAVQLIDTMTHGFADLHENGIYQLDVKLQNTGIFVKGEKTYVEDEDGKKKLHLSGKEDLSMKIHDFGKAANLKDRNTLPSGEKEIPNFNPEGTPITMSPEMAGGTVEANKKLQALKDELAKPGVSQARKNEIDKEIKALRHETYSKMDAYSMALMGYMLVTGKMPTHIKDISKKCMFDFQIQIQIGKKLGIGGEMEVKIDPDNEIGKKMREEFTAAAKERAAGGGEEFDPNLLNMILKGLNSDPANRPSAADFQAYFRSKG